jgi:hypothetical protein
VSSDTHIVIAFDADARGHAATRELGAWLEDREHPTSDLQPPAGITDVNDWPRTDPTGFHDAIRATRDAPTTLDIETPVLEH